MPQDKTQLRQNATGQNATRTKCPRIKRNIHKMPQDKTQQRNNDKMPQDITQHRQNDPRTKRNTDKTQQRRNAAGQNATKTKCPRTKRNTDKTQQRQNAARQNAKQRECLYFDEMPRDKMVMITVGKNIRYICFEGNVAQLKRLLSSSIP